MKRKNTHKYMDDTRSYVTCHLLSHVWPFVCLERVDSRRQVVHINVWMSDPTLLNVFFDNNVSFIDLEFQNKS